MTQAIASAGHTDRNQGPLVESLLQTINTLVERLNDSEATKESEPHGDS